MTTAVLALQGAFAEHERMLARLGEPCVELRDEGDLQLPFERLVLCGGESTTQRKLLVQRGMLVPLRQRIRAGMPVLATCAGLILLAEEVEGGLPTFATLPATAVRNAYGRQLASFHARAAFAGLGEVPMSFIRAPYLREVHGDAQVLAQVQGRIVAARCGAQLACAFHPELDGSTRIHELFLEL